MAARCTAGAARDASRSVAMPKSRTLTLPVSRDQDVLGLDVAVDDQVLMRVRDGGTHLNEEPQAIVQREILLFTTAVIGTPSTYSTTTYGSPRVSCRHRAGV